MVDAHALGACGLGRAGSNPASPTRDMCTTLPLDAKHDLRIVRFRRGLGKASRQSEEAPVVPVHAGTTASLPLS